MFTARMRLICLVVVLCRYWRRPSRARTLPAAPAAAAAIKNGKRTTVEVKDVERRFTKLQAPPPAPKEKGPRLRAEDLQMRRGVMQKIMANQIQKMRALVQVTTDDDPQKPDFFFRLGELYVEKQRYFFDQAHALDQKIFELPPAQRGPLQATQQRYLREEQTWMLEAVKAYIAATRYPKYERMDEVLFRLATQLTTREEGRAGARVLPSADQGLPDVEVHPGRVPGVRRARVRGRRDGGRAEVLREGRAVPEVQRLPLRRLQEGVVLREPGRLQDRARNVRRRRAPHPDGKTGR